MPNNSLFTKAGSGLSLQDMGCYALTQVPESKWPLHHNWQHQLQMFLELARSTGSQPPGCQASQFSRPWHGFQTWLHKPSGDSHTHENEKHWAASNPLSSAAIPVNITSNTSPGAGLPGGACDSISSFCALSICLEEFETEPDSWPGIKMAPEQPIPTGIAPLLHPGQ